MLELTKETFEEEVLKAEGKVLVDFYGDGCVPCQALMPHVHELAEQYGDKIKFCALNTTKARRLAIAQKVLGQECRLHRDRPHRHLRERRSDRFLREGRGYSRGRQGHGRGQHLIFLCSMGVRPCYKSTKEGEKHHGNAGRQEGHHHW